LTHENFTGCLPETRSCAKREQEDSVLSSASIHQWHIALAKEILSVMARDSHKGELMVAASVSVCGEEQAGRRIEYGRAEAKNGLEAKSHPRIYPILDQRPVSRGGVWSVYVVSPADIGSLRYQIF
jgi:hypothetical protein